jgi:4-hydroxy-tetrahydrodipicolinate reductase
MDLVVAGVGPPRDTVAGVDRDRTRVCLAGVTGWVGSALAPAILDADDLVLAGAVSRSAAGTDLGEILGRPAVGVTVASSVEEALAAEVDVLVDYTAASAAKGNVLAAIGRGVHAVVGTSGLDADVYAEIDAAARAADVGVVAAGNFSLLAALLQHAALLAARHVDHWEVIDYASAGKADVPSGTARELAERLGQVRQPELGRPLDDLHGPTEARGARVDGTQVHSVRLPSFVVSTEVIFGLPDERLSLRHEAGPNPDPYIGGTLLAVRAVGGRTGLTRGLDSLLFD